MTINFNDDLEGLWVAPMSGADFLGGLIKTENGYLFRSRIRVYVDDKTFDSKDLKTWYDVTLPGEEMHEAIDKIRKLLRSYIPKCGGDISSISESLRDGRNTEEFFEDATSSPSFNKLDVGRVQ